MAPYKFLNSIENRFQFEKYGDGSSMRDYTYIDDIVDGVIASLNSDNKNSEIINLGNSSPISLNKFIETCEKVTKKKASYKQINEQLGDVPITFADITKAEKLLNYKPKVSIEEGLTRTYNWLKEYNNSEKIFIYN